MAPTFHLLIVPSTRPKLPASSQNRYEILPNNTTTIIQHHCPTATKAFYDHTNIYALLSLVTIIITLLCLARIWNEYRHSYSYEEFQSLESKPNFPNRILRNESESEQLRARLKEISRENERERERERMPLLRENFEGGRRGKGRKGGGYCTIVEVDEEDEEIV